MQGNIQVLKKDNEALQIAEGELRHLRETIEALRSELEQHSFNQETAVQKIAQNSADEIQQLKSTATNLRDELESMHFEKDSTVQQAV
ncbi:MAG TPA: hypothetical protein EYQ26_17770, partial [Rhodospirillales bacterium]|nr:hypothetical protein [Rhodospirillales bacterium]